MRTNHSGTRGPTTRFIRGSIVATAFAVAAVGLSATSASAADNMDTTGNVVVQAGITLTALTPDFTMTGIPGQTVQSGPVTYNVETNNPTGYTVTVLSDSATMDPLGTSPDVIPIADLTVRETGTTAYTPMSNTAAVNVHTQITRSANGGDELSTDYQMRIPVVAVDTYSATLNYLAVSTL